MSIKGLKSEDLYAICEACGGTGRKQEGSGGSHAHWSFDGPCYECGQRGYFLTDEGKVLKDFMLKIKQ